MAIKGRIRNAARKQNPQSLWMLLISTEMRCWVDAVTIDRIALEQFCGRRQQLFRQSRSHGVRAAPLRKSPAHFVLSRPDKAVVCCAMPPGLLPLAHPISYHEPLSRRLAGSSRPVL